MDHVGLDACRERRLEDLLSLYADQATLDCCSGERFVGRPACFAIGRPSYAAQLRPHSNWTKSIGSRNAFGSTTEIITAAL